MRNNIGQKVYNNVFSNSLSFIVILTSQHATLYKTSQALASRDTGRSNAELISFIRPFHRFTWPALILKYNLKPTFTSAYRVQRTFSETRIQIPQLGSKNLFPSRRTPSLSPAAVKFDCNAGPLPARNAHV